MITLYEKAVAISIKLRELDREVDIAPEIILRKGNVNLINIIYERMCKNV